MSDAYIGYYHGDDQVKLTLVLPGRTRLHLLCADPGLYHLAVSREEEHHIRRIDYPLQRAARLYASAGRRYGATKSALRLLRKVRILGSDPTVHVHEDDER